MTFNEMYVQAYFAENNVPPTIEGLFAFAGGLTISPNSFERPETQVTLRTGHIGDTLPLNVGSQGMGFGEGDSESQAF